MNFVSYFSAQFLVYFSDFLMQYLLVRSFRLTQTIHIDDVDANCSYDDDDDDDDDDGDDDNDDDDDDNDDDGDDDDDDNNDDGDDDGDDNDDDGDDDDNNDDGDDDGDDDDDKTYILSAHTPCPHSRPAKQGRSGDTVS